jgi:hypothetical protein
MQRLQAWLLKVGRIARKLAVRTVAVMLIAVGMVVFPLPIPIGLLMIVTGLAILISSSRTVARHVREYRRRNTSVDTWLRKAEPRIPSLFRPPLRMTDPLREPPAHDGVEPDVNLPRLPDEDDEGQ